jgi:cytidine deaminase
MAAKKTTSTSDTRKLKPKPKRATRKPALERSVINVLLEVAGNMRPMAHVPYSRYQVGAALLSDTGNVYGGCNVENASYGLSICAERTAYVKAVSEGERAFVAIAVVTTDGGTPCGACRQFMAEFGLDTQVILANTKGKFSITTVGALLPDAFVLR